MIIAIIIGFIAVLLDLQNGWLFLLWFATVIGIVFFGSCYFMWNVASIAIILIIERKEAEEWELIVLKYWLKRNIMIAGIWAGFLLFSVFFQPGWAILATANGVVLAFIIMFAESEESPFETGERTADMISKKRN
jgi:purine-cytosine permease-like protein